MTGYLWALLAMISGVILTAIGDLASEEIRGWLDLLPRAILRLAAHRLEPAQQVTLYEEEWLPELCYILQGAESRPITRLVRGLNYALGLLIAANRISRHRAIHLTGAPNHCGRRSRWSRTERAPSPADPG